jgi:hypothetical protein
MLGSMSHDTAATGSIRNGAMAASKFNADTNVGDAQTKAASATAADKRADAETDAANAADTEVSLSTTIATIGVIGVAAALFDVALIPGMIIGVAAAYAPKYVPGLGDRLQPLFNYTVRGAYKMTRSARSAVADAQERMHDIAAEVAAEENAGAGGAKAAGAAS